MERGLFLVPAVVAAAVVLAVAVAVRMRRRAAACAAADRELEESREREEALIRTVDQLGDDASSQQPALRAVR
jgi:hypothetical protein